MHPCVLPMHWQGQTSRECIVHSVSYAIRTMFSPLCLSKQCSAADVALALCATHYVSVLSFTQRRLHLGVLYATHYVSVLCITQRRLHLGALWTTHHVSVLCIKSRKPAGEGHVLRITYPHYVSSTESPPERAMYYALRIRIMYQALKDCPRELDTTHYVSALCIKR